MPNIASILKSEISRVARKEVRSEIESLRKSNAQHRGAIAALRRQLESVQRDLKRLSRSAPPASSSATRSSGDDAAGVNRRFSPSRLAAHRGKMKLSAAAYGKLVGIGGQTIYNWEQGKSRPSSAQIRQLALLKEMSRTALMEKIGGQS